MGQLMLVIVLADYSYGEQTSKDIRPNFKNINIYMCFSMAGDILIENP